MQPTIGFRCYRLKSPSIVNMNYSGNLCFFPILKVADSKHERTLRKDPVEVEPFAHSFKQDGGRKRAKRFAMFDPAIKYVFGVRAPWITKNTALSQRSWTEFGSAIKPPNNLPVAQ